MTGKIPHPGCNEIEWCADLKTLAEQIGKEVLGYRIRWRVETKIAKVKKRSDVLIEKAADGSLILAGEANDEH